MQREALGISKLAPFLTLLVVVFVLIVAIDTARWVGGSLPPVILWTSPDDIIATDRTEDLLDIWDHFPNVRNAGELAIVVNELYSQDRDKSGYSHWRGQGRNRATSFSRSRSSILYGSLDALSSLFIAPVTRFW